MNTDLDPQSISRYSAQAEMLRAWATEGDESAKVQLLAWAPTVPRQRTTTTDGPTFRFSSGALANRRLFELRLAACFEGDLDAALAAAAKHRECTGELSLIAAILADRADEPALATYHEKDMAGILVSLAQTDPERLATNLGHLLGKGSYKSWYKWELVGLLPLRELVGAQAGDKVGIVGIVDRAVITLVGSADAKKLTVSVKVAKTSDKIPTTYDKAVQAAGKKLGKALGSELPTVVGFNTATRDIDFEDQAGRNGRSQYLRALLAEPPAELDLSRFSPHPNQISTVLLDFMRFGVSIVGDGNESWRKGFDDLERHVLPGHFETLCRRSWGDDAEAELARYRSGE